jgi:sugar O-acyltransferase, sialic acid O-acetyltransferase NeuD family
MSGRSLAILGAGGHGRVVADTALAAGWPEVAFFDDSFPERRETGDWPIAGRAAELMGRAADFDAAIAGIGNPAARLSLSDDLAAAGFRLATIIHPRAWLSPRAGIGEGSLLSAGAMVNVGARLGRAVIVNTGATVDHDCRIGNGVHIAPGAHLSGEVTVGEKSWIGVGATVRQGIRIGAGVMVGAGAVVVSDLPDGVTAIGCPARPRS